MGNGKGRLRDAKALTRPSVADVMGDMEGEEFNDDAQVHVVEKIVEVEREVIPAGAIVPAGDKAMQFGRFTLGETGIEGGDDATQEEWNELGLVLFKVEKASQWWLADWLNTVNLVWKYSIENIAQTVEMDADTLYDWKSVAKNIPHPLRNGKLSFSHHRAVAYFKTKDGEPDYDRMQMWLDRAASAKWGVKDLRAAVVADKRRSRRVSTSLPALANKDNKQAFSRVWSAIEKGKKPSVEDITRLRRVLDELESRLG